MTQETTNIVSDIAWAITEARVCSAYMSMGISASIDEVLDAVRAAWDGETDYAILLSEGPGGRDMLDVWGWTDETPESEMDWRILFTLS